MRLPRYRWLSAQGQHAQRGAAGSSTLPVPTPPPERMIPAAAMDWGNPNAPMNFGADTEANIATW